MLLFNFLSCVTKPAPKTLKQFPHNKALTSEAPELQIYFPEFTDEEGKVIGGDGYIIIFPNNQLMVVDGYYAEAAEKYVKFIKDLGYTKIDYLMASHFHGDHIQSLPALVDNFEIGTFYSCGAPTKTWWSYYLLAKLESKAVNSVVLKEGDELDIGQVHLKVYSPDYSQEDIYNVMYNPGKTAELINNSSLVFKLTYNNFSMMFTGDVYKTRDKVLVKKYGKELKSDLLKVAHHGDCYTASSYSWIGTVKPDYGIVIDDRYVTRKLEGYFIKNRYSLFNTILLYNSREGFLKVQSDGVEYKITNSIRE